MSECKNGLYIHNHTLVRVVTVHSLVHSHCLNACADFFGYYVPLISSMDTVQGLFRCSRWES